MDWLILGLLAALLYLVYTSRRDPQGVTSEILQRAVSDIVERISRVSGETRQEVSDRLNLEFQGISDRMEARLRESRQELDQKLERIGREVQVKLDENVREGFKHFEKVQETLKAAESQMQNLSFVGTSINELNNLLKLPHLRGSFGEAVLENLLSDFLPPTAFELQAQIVPGSTERVDALIHYHQAKLPVDSKFPREQVLPLFETSDPQKLEQAREKLAEVVKRLAREIAAKYIHPEYGTAEMALLFLPSETLYFEIIRNPDLWEQVCKHKVFPTSPNNMVVALKGLSMGLKYYAMAQGAQDTIEEIKKARKHFEEFLKQFGAMGDSIEKADRAFRIAGTHLERYSRSTTRLTGESLPQISNDSPTENPALPGPQKNP